MIIDRAELESSIFRLGTEIFQEVEQSTPGIFDPNFYSAKLIDWAMADEEFKVSLFRFVDVFPTLSSSAAIVRHAQEYFEPVAHRIPGILKWGLRVDPDSISAKLAAPIISRQIRAMAERFIVGETPKNALRALRSIRSSGMAFTVDLLGEATLGEQESLEYFQRYTELLDTLLAEVPQWRESRPLIEGHLGERSAVNVSVKLSALYSQSRPLSTSRAIEVLSERLMTIFRKARAGGAYVFVDMEDTSLVSITLESVKRALSDSSLNDYDRCGFVVQAYLRRTEQDVDDILRWARARGTPVGMRLVKGAYWDTETVISRQNQWPVPVWERKSSTDACYERIALTLLQNTQSIYPAFASHNLRSLCFVATAAEALGLPRSAFELQALYGMAEPIKKSFVKRGYLFREYAPVGKLIPGMSYLVRRLLENTSNEGFLRQTFREHEKPEHLLASPSADPTDTGIGHIADRPRDRFANLPLMDFSEDAARSRFAKAIDSLRGRVRSTPEIVKPVVEGEYVAANRSLDSISPEDPSLVVARVQLADEALATRAVEGLARSFATWRDTPVARRADILFRAAELMTARRVELAAVMVLEAGKQWAEADGDVAEAVDFLNYYAREALLMAPPRRMGDLPGELNTYFYEPRGITTVIAPWNFPLAIPCGMFAASLVTGNCTILKPAEQTSLIARELYDTFLAAGLPKEVSAFLPGIGEEIGEQLVRDRRISTIVFTGSKKVGLSIVRSAGETVEGQRNVKRVVAEMGGKNAIIVDEDADLDEAVRGVVASAFGFQGQKCSACSRLILVGDIGERFAARLKDAVESLRLGAASDPATSVGPVIDEDAYRRIGEVIRRAKATLTLLCEGVLPATSSAGYLIPPTVFIDVPPSHEIFREEIFGPVLAVARVKSFDAALELALDSDYALT
ncbi:MAG: proline dehydrogenase family protein, partial [Deltaproteobacteria bacterium]|nr:proline dehydrogenase family protein [Deltaproteobacteria bacterium]